jgi:hypothetical protein
MFIMMKKSGFVYIYNPQQAAFYISKGMEVKDTGINKTTNKVWYKFGYQETSEVYSEWCNRK